jgi:hypothetical protein
MAPRKPAKKSSTTMTKMTKVVISGRGLSFHVLDIDHETFGCFTQSGISDDIFEDLKSQLIEAGAYITAPFLDETTVAIDGKKFHSSWPNIKGQCRNVMPPAINVYDDVPPATYSVILEVSHQGDFVNAEIANFDPLKLSFDLEHVALAKGRNYALLDPYYGNEPLDFGVTKTIGEIYVVDRTGKRYEIKHTDSV